MRLKNIIGYISAQGARIVGIIVVDGGNITFQIYDVSVLIYSGRCNIRNIRGDGLLLFISFEAPVQPVVEAVEPVKIAVVNIRSVVEIVEVALGLQIVNGVIARYDDVTVVSVEVYVCAVVFVFDEVDDFRPLDGARVQVFALIFARLVVLLYKCL